MVLNNKQEKFKKYDFLKTASKDEIKSFLENNKNSLKLVCELGLSDFYTKYRKSEASKIAFNDYLLLAIKNKKVEMVEKILSDKRNEFKGNINFFFEAAIDIESLEITKLLFKYLKINSKDLQFSFFLACRNGLFEIVEYYIKNKKVDPSYNYNEAYFMAIKHKRMKVANILNDNWRVSFKFLLLNLFNCQKYELK